MWCIDDEFIFQVSWTKELKQDQTWDYVMDRGMLRTSEVSKNRQNIVIF